MALFCCGCGEAPSRPASWRQPDHPKIHWHVRRANMTQPTILVTGATGNTGGAVVSELLHRGVPVRAMVHSRDARSAALQASGAEVVVADIFDPDQLVAAMRGVQRAYYVPPYHPYVIQSAVTFAVAAREAKLEGIVQLGQWLSH